MKIAYISTIQVPSTKANSMQVMKMCQAFTQLGNEVLLILPFKKTSNEAELGWKALSKHYGLQEKFDIKWLKHGASRKKHLFTWRAVSYAIQKRADIVYSRSIPPAVMGLIRNLPAILEMHQPPTGVFGPMWFKLFILLGGKKRLVYITEALRQEIQEQYPAARKIISLVASSGVDVERYSQIIETQTARSILKIDKKPLIVCAGHLYPGRGMKLFVELAKKLPNMQFIWVGGDSKDVKSWNDVVVYEKLGNIKFVGFQPNELLPIYLFASDILLIPYEGYVAGSGGQNIASVSSPMKMFEYMASGKPIISSDLVVLREVLRQESAIFCKSKDVSCWTQAICDLLSNPEKAAIMGNASRADVMKFSWKQRASKIIYQFL
jgi:glycosyltransferase involved in cell wall biosynthesis